MAKDKKGNDKVEFPKLIMFEGKKVRVLNKEEEAKYKVDKFDKKDEKPAGWGK